MRPVGRAIWFSDSCGDINIWDCLCFSVLIYFTADLLLWWLCSVCSVPLSAPTRLQALFSVDSASVSWHKPLSDQGLSSLWVDYVILIFSVIKYNDNGDKSTSTVRPLVKDENFSQEQLWQDAQNVIWRHQWLLLVFKQRFSLEVAGIFTYHRLDLNLGYSLSPHHHQWAAVLSVCVIWKKEFKLKFCEVQLSTTN